MNLNRVFLIGRLTAAPILRSTPSGTQVATFSLATNRVWFDKVAGKKEETEFHNIVVWGKQAESSSRFLTKGAMAMIEGRIQTRSWDDKEGNKRKTTEIICENVQFGPRPFGAGAATDPHSQVTSSFTAPSMDQTVKESAAEIPTINVEDNFSGEFEVDGIGKEDLPF